jgi:hypothetical protein
MSLKAHRQAVRLARKAREAARRYASSHDSREYFWHRKESLRGMCAVVSFAAFEQLQEAELPGWRFAKGKFRCPDERINEAHCWLVHQDGTILDLTAGQFYGMPEIHLTVNDPRYVPTVVTDKPSFICWPACISPFGRNTTTSRRHIEHTREHLKNHGTRHVSKCS